MGSGGAWRKSKVEYSDCPKLFGRILRNVFEAETPDGKKKFSNIVAHLDPLASRRIVIGET